MAINMLSGAGSTAVNYNIVIAARNQSEVSSYSRSILLDVMKSSSVERVVITSVVRNAHEQARAMYKNVEKHGFQNEKKMYYQPGKNVLDHMARESSAIAAAEKRGIATGLTDAWSRQRHLVWVMENRINSEGPHNVSAHCGNYLALNVFDVDPESLYPKNQSSFIENALHHHSIYKFLYPPKTVGESAYHFEIIQGNDGFVSSRVKQTA